MAASVQVIARILGLRRPLESMSELRDLVEHGLPKSSLGHTVDYIAPDAAEAILLKQKLIPSATYKRRTTILKREESERIERLARLMAMAEDAIGSAEGARAFLFADHPELGGKRAIDVAATELGAREVEEIIWRAEHGIPA